MSVSVPPSSGSTSRLAFPGAIVAGRYRLEEVVGIGGMGSVWRATHTGLGEQVAVKLVSANFVRSSEALRRFDTEAKAAAKLRSRHVPQVFDNGVLDDGTPFLVMELLHGESLAARVNRLGPIGLLETISILEQCCRALSRAHSLGIVHRDIKPENVYLAQSFDDEGYVAKVLDFGIAKVASSLSDDGRSSTRTGTLLGTPLYMSPEQARGLRSIDFHTDLYSLGLVAFTMLTGRLPFGGDTLGELLLQICTEPLPSLRALAPSMPATVEDWFQRACARLPEDRFASAQGFIEALRVAAGISSPGASDLAARSPSLPDVRGSAEASLSPSVAPAALSAPSTNGGASLGPSSVPFSGNRRTALVLAVLGLAAAVALLVASRVASRGRKGAAAPDVEGATGPAISSVRPDADAGVRSVTLAPLPIDSSLAATPSTSVASGPPAPARSSVLPAQPAVHLALPAPIKPAAPPRPTTAKSNGAIDLGY